MRAAAKEETTALPGAVAPRLLALLATTAVAAVVVFRLPAIPQDPAYHRFADDRTWLGVPSFWNVASNLPFLLVGMAGITGIAGAARRRRHPAGPGEALHPGERAEEGAWLCLFLGVAFTAFGSAWYHLHPSNASLVWDRLPMTLGFMGLLAGIVGERVGRRAYRLLLWPLLGLGVASVLYWYAGELRGAGDLRLYALVQFLPLLLIPLLMALYAPRYSHGGYVFLALACYAGAKALEHYDLPIYRALGVSGHTGKHLAAAAGCWVLLRMWSVRSPLPPGGASRSPARPGGA